MLTIVSTPSTMLTLSNVSLTTRTHYLVQPDRSLSTAVSVAKVTTVVAETSVNTKRKRKGKKEYLYSAFIQRLVSRHLNMDHTVLLQITPRLPFLRKRSSDGASIKCGGENLIAAHYSFIDPERTKG